MPVQDLQPGIGTIIDDAHLSLDLTRDSLVGDLQGKPIKDIKESVRALNNTINAVGRQINEYVAGDVEEGIPAKLIELNEKLSLACDTLDALREKNITVLPKRAYFQRLWAWITGKTSVVVETASNAQSARGIRDRAIVAAFAKMAPKEDGKTLNLVAGKDTNKEAVFRERKVTITPKGLMIGDSAFLLKSWADVRSQLEPSFGAASQLFKEAATKGDCDKLLGKAVIASGRSCYCFVPHSGSLLSALITGPSGKLGELHIASQQGVEKYDVTYDDAKFYCSIGKEECTSNTLEGLRGKIEGLDTKPVSLESVKPVLSERKAKRNAAKELLKSKELALPRDLRLGIVGVFMKYILGIFVSSDSVRDAMRAGCAKEESSCLVVKKGNQYELRVVGEKLDKSYPLDISSEPGKISITVDNEKKELVFDASENGVKQLKKGLAKAFGTRVKLPSGWFASSRGVEGHRQDVRSCQKDITTEVGFERLVGKIGDTAIGAYYLKLEGNGFTATQVTSIEDGQVKYKDTHVEFADKQLKVGEELYDCVDDFLKAKFADAISPEELRVKEKEKDQKVEEFNGSCFKGEGTLEEIQECRSLFSQDGLWWIEEFSEDGNTSLSTVTSTGQLEETPVTMVNENGWKIKVKDNSYDSMEALFTGEKLAGKQNLKTHLPRYKLHKKLESGIVGTQRGLLTGLFWGSNASKYYKGEISREEAEEKATQDPVIFKEDGQYKVAYWCESTDKVEVKELKFETESVPAHYDVGENGFATIEGLQDFLEEAGELEPPEPEARAEGPLHAAPPSTELPFVEPPTEAATLTERLPPRAASLAPEAEAPERKIPEWVGGITSNNKAGLTNDAQIRKYISHLVEKLVEKVDAKKSLESVTVASNKVLTTPSRRFYAWVRALAAEGARPAAVSHDDLVALTAKLPAEEKEWLKIVARTILPPNKQAGVLEAIG